MNYWLECIEISFEEHGIIATPDQMVAVAGDVQIAHENQHLMSYTPPNPLHSEIRELKTELKKEREKVICTECKGSGRVHTYGPYHWTDSECHKCRGEGRVTP